jgi:hypothetical protein
MTERYKRENVNSFDPEIVDAVQLKPRHPDDLPIEYVICHLGYDHHLGTDKFVSGVRYGADVGIADVGIFGWEHGRYFDCLDAARRCADDRISEYTGDRFFDYLINASRRCTTLHN